MASPLPATKAPSTKKVTPEAPKNSLDKALSVDKDIVDELLLVCGVIGTSVQVDEKGQERLVPVSDCLNWLQDLQRALRRDDDLFRPVSLLLGKWKVVQQKLLPLVLSCRYDTNMVLTIGKILVILTKPLAETTIRAGKMVIDPKKHSESVVKQQIKLRDNALAQADQLLEYKRAFCHKKGLLSVFMSLLAEPLSKSNRTDQDHLTVELILHLIRNLLAAEPILQNQKAAELHYEMIQLIDQELVLETILVLAAEIEQRENAQYNLLLLELLHHLFKHTDPTAMAKPPQKSSLMAQLNREKQTYAVATTTRHAHFGGTLSRKQPGGATSYVSTTALLNKTNNQAAVKTRKNKQSEPFVGSNRSHQHSRVNQGSTPSQTKAYKVLNTFCQRFVLEGYGPTMKSLKNEFRRDSVRLEDNDRHLFFRIVWFLKQWWRACPEQVIDEKASTSIGQFIFTMDIFTFNLVLNATDSYRQFKKYTKLGGAVALLSEMMHMLYTMYTSKENTEQLMSMGLMDRLFYGNEPIDRLPRLFSTWEPGTLGREYLCDLVEICHVQLKLLEAHAQACDKLPDPKTVKYDTLLKMKATAAHFSVSSYFNRRLVSNQTIHMYTQLLSQYAVNSVNVNHRVMMFLRRISKVQIAVQESVESDMPQNPLATKTVTLEPVLYNISLLNVMNTILNEKSIRGDNDYKTLLDFCTRFVSKFAKAAEENPMLFVEALFKHNHIGRFCENVTNMYVTEECRMIAERRLLMEENERFEKQIEKVRNEEDSDDDELEFEDYGISSVPQKDKRKVLDDSDDEDEDKEEASAEKAEAEEKESAVMQPTEDIEKDEETTDAQNESPKKKRRVLADEDDDDGDSDDEAELETEDMGVEEQQKSGASDVDDGSKDNQESDDDEPSDEEVDDIEVKETVASDEAVDDGSPAKKPAEEAESSNSDDEVVFSSQPKKRSRILLEDSDEE